MDQQASKTQGALPRAHQRSQVEGAVNEPAMKQDGTRREWNPGVWPQVASSRCPSAVASDAGGRLSMTEAKHTTTSRRQGAAKQATTGRGNLALSRSFHTKAMPVGHALHNRNEGSASLNYLDTKNILNRKMAQHKKGMLLDQEIKILVEEWHNTKTEDKLNTRTMQKELEVLKDKLRKYNVPQLGDIPDEWNDRTMRILVCQMGGCAIKVAQEIKIAAMERLIKH
jgi:hypothetical protein